ncbi:MAG: bifunctional diaminohydroxyphosphoribosylaminopyrimidine deaminase/5-amino-6-(5-phosphoribosylamino)uracil reductase RibD [Burkholderiales bacterium]|jgi:diaminohydroxyphosphoribosylaminopyrimidine deaminase/5-amino-6-(5-phosphoribosylamino)uracil reductase|nr:bifunctional diaminohydroxyphosphoribosylaminopyrimidine deaminase/5-amino-6-(5-phosphoribosylamino)uracil reductase RibD [Burkholderiales bacterium]
MRWSEADVRHMQRALALAARGLATTTPNPRVGCVVVKNGEVLGEGWHQKAGEAHAEPAALADARARGHDVRGATMIVSLEPCSHHGRVPPCTEAIIAAGIGRVIAAATDPNPQAAHGGQTLQAAGIAFESGLLEEEARELNCGFFSRVQRGRPWVRSKIAASLDGRTALADGRSQWITQAAARDDGHAFRARACALLTGIGTVLADDPSLTVRAVTTTRQPLRIVLDRLAKTPATSRLMADGGDTLIVTAAARSPSWPSHVRHLLLPATGAEGKYGGEDLRALMAMLAKMEINELHVEAGARLNGALLEAGLIDELLVYLAPKVLGAQALPMFDPATPLNSLDAYADFSFMEAARIGDDVRLRLRRKES